MQNYQKQSGFYQRRQVNIPALILVATFVISLIVVALVVRAYMNRPTGGLAVGTASQAQGMIDIPIYKPVNFSGKSRDEVLEYRKALLAKVPALYSGEYIPRKEVFGEIQDGLPWFGIAGYFYYGPGPKSTIGKSAETRFILNPHLLVAPEFWGLSIWGRRYLKWNTANLTEERILADDFPLYPRPETLKWWPAESKAEVSYDISNYLRLVNQFTATPLTKAHISFGLIPYNARDFGFEALFLAPNKSENVEDFSRNSRPYLIEDALHRSRACLIPSECNHMTAPRKEVSDFRVTDLPARAFIKLWRSPPHSVQEQEDFTFLVALK